MRATPPTACAMRTPAAPGPTADARAQPGSYASTVLGPDRRSAGQARRLTRTTLTRWGLPHLADDAETIASELAANAVAHAVDPQDARPAIIFAIHYRLSGLQITIWDNGPGQPVRADPGPDAVTGRGLTIIDALTDSNWGWWPTPRSGGKVVHATLAASGPGDSLTLSTHQEEPQMEQQAPPPADLNAPCALRMMLIRRYSYLTLKFSNPIISASGRWEASWNGGGTAADTEAALLATVLEKFQDCGGAEHSWETTGTVRDPLNGENVILTQRRVCNYCDGKERVITLYHPGPTAEEDS